MLVHTFLEAVQENSLAVFNLEIFFPYQLSAPSFNHDSQFLTLKILFHRNLESRNTKVCGVARLFMVCTGKNFDNKKIQMTSKNIAYSGSLLLSSSKTKSGVDFVNVICYNVIM